MDSTEVNDRLSIVDHENRFEKGFENKDEIEENRPEKHRLKAKKTKEKF